MSVTITKEATAGFFASNDCQVTVKPNEKNTNEVIIESKVLHLFGEKMLSEINEIIKKYDVSNASICIKDKGALDYVLQARVETAIRRAM